VNGAKTKAVVFTGAGVTVTQAGKTATVNIPGGGGPPPPPPPSSGPASFDAALGANQTKVVNDGSFTVSTATDNAGTCGAITIVNSAQTYFGWTEEPADDTPFGSLAGVVTNLAPTTAGGSLTEYAGTTISGNDSSSGVVGQRQIGSTCLSSGHIV
jgi:hypothetical protein